MEILSSLILFPCTVFEDNREKLKDFAYKKEKLALRSIHNLFRSS